MDLISAITYLGLAGIIVCGIVGLIKKQYQPQPFSFLIYFISGAISLFYMFVNQSHWLPLIVEATSVIWNFTLTIIGFWMVFHKRIQYHLKKIDFALFGLAILGFIIYFLIDNLTFAAIVNSSISLFAPLITIRKLWEAPQTEMVSLYSAAALAWTANAFRMQNLNDFIIFGIWTPVSILSLGLLIVRKYIIPPNPLNQYEKKT
ncbi:MAG: hypothetical protein LBC43_00075 [Bifidobacteriaceae bacterium]|nr:hypothetical protein [Bifidobacteriaceae bacterium]